MIVQIKLANGKVKRADIDHLNIKEAAKAVGVKKSEVVSVKKDGI